MTQKPCPICKLDGQEVEESDYGERNSLHCPRCGTFRITDTAASMAQSQSIAPELSAWIRERTERGIQVPEINSDSLKSIASALPNYGVSDKQLLLLRSIERQTEFPGQKVLLVGPYDYPLAWASRDDELAYLLKVLAQRNLVVLAEDDAAEGNSWTWQVQISADGWDYLEQHNRVGAIGNQVFVAMSFADELHSAWCDGIEPSLSKAGYKPYRVDSEPHIDKIDSKIVAEIKNSQFLVADVTNQRAGVYFEAGLAMGLGLPVFWAVRQDDLQNVHFDTRQYNHIVWKDEADLYNQLYLFVVSVVGKGGVAN